MRRWSIYECNIQKAAICVKFILESVGSVKDDEVIAAAEEQGIAMIFTGVRKFNH